MTDRTPELIVRDAIVVTLGVTPERASDPNMTIMKDLGGDSLDGIEIAMLIEDEIGVQFRDLEIESCRTVGEIVAMTAKRMGVAV